MRQQIWAALCNLRFKTYYISSQLVRFQKQERNLNIILAFASCSSIASWAVWQTVPFLWAGIIALSQVIAAIKPQFPLSKTVRELNSALIKLEYLALDFEKFWYQCEHKQLSDDLITETYYDLRKKSTEILNFSDEIILPTIRSYIDKANLQTKTYLESNFRVTVNVN